MSYIPNTKEERQIMLGDIGYLNIDDLFKSIPESIKLAESLKLPAGKSEQEVCAHFERLAEKNKIFSSIFRGAGAYDHYIPAVVRHLASRSEFVTAYTPYQPEMSQGILQLIFEYQSMICMLTGMDVSNAGVYDGSQAAAEAFAMCRERKRQKALAFDNIKPQTLSVLKTYAKSAGVEIDILPSNNGLCDIEALKEALDETVACVYIEIPNFYGLLDDGEKLAELIHAAGAKLIIGSNPLSLALLKTPAEHGADVAVGETQVLGMPLSFGGPYLGYMAASNANMRRLPGRIVGETADSEGRRAFVLTLQTREQHIRREKASSSICSNEALCAATAAIYCAAMGREGLCELAKSCIDNAHYLASELCKIKGVSLKYDSEFFNEFVTSYPLNSDELMKKLESEGILGGLVLEDNSILWCATEKNSLEDMNRLVSIVREVVENG